MELLILVLGLAIFLGAHSLKFLASGKPRFNRGGLRSSAVGARRGVGAAA